MKSTPLFLAILLSLLASLSPLPTAEPTSPSAATDEANPFGIASGAEWAGEYPRFEPLLHQAGVGWLRYFSSWNRLQPQQGQWDWQRTDEFVAASKTNHLHIIAPLAYFARWASSGGDDRTFPVKDMQFWRDYVAGVVARYHEDIHYWEVWNEPQAFQKNGTPQYYADMVREAYDAAKKIDPHAKLGLTTANFAVAYLDMVLKAGVADHFDFLCVHPYENVEQLNRPGGEVYFLSMAGNLRRLLAAHRQRSDIPLWITEIGAQTPIQPDAEKDARQAQLLAKIYLLSLAQGFDKVFWFEARGPAYGKGTDFGIIRRDWTPRPAYTALATMTAALGEAPQYAGWLDFDGSYAFLFQHRRGSVLAAWSPVGQKRPLKFAAPVTVTGLEGKPATVAAGQEIALTNQPVFIADLPDDLVEKAKANCGKPFPWDGDFTHAQQVICRWGTGAVRHGLEPLREPASQKLGDETFALLKKAAGLSFRVNPGFAPFGTTNLTIKIVARRAATSQAAGFQLMAESLGALHGYARAGWWTIPADDQWHEHIWRLSDANFVGTWGYNFALSEIRGELLVKEISLQKIGGLP